MAVAQRAPEGRSRARWMGPVMVVVAGMAAATPAGAGVIEIPEWRSVFAAQGVTGAIAVRRLGQDRSYVSDLDAAARGLPPASTFKLPHLLVAMETGVVRDLEQVYPWDGRPRPIAAWNQDLSVGRAVAVSSVPVFQTIAHTIGEQRMAAWLRRLDYGNADVSGGIDRFWLDGGLKVTPTQQLDFVERLLLGTLPASSRAQTVTRDAVPGEVLACGVTVRGKTGWARVNGEDGPDIGWWVGWVERPREVWLFATAVEGHPERIRSARRDVTLGVLEGLGLMADTGPDGGCPRQAAEAAAGRSVARAPE